MGGLVAGGRYGTYSTTVRQPTESEMSLKRPQDLVFTLFGESLPRQKRPVWVGSLIALLKPFKVSEGAVRTVLSRMARKRWLSSRRVGRNSYYQLTARGRRIVSHRGAHEAGQA